MKKRNMFILVGVLYVLAVALVAYRVYSQKSESYSYDYNFETFALNAGEVNSEGIEVDSSSEYSGVIATAPGASLRSGDYVLTFDYEAEDNQSIQMYANSNLDEMLVLPASEKSVSKNFSVWPACDKFKIKIHYNGSGRFVLKGISIASNRPLYTDYAYYSILVVLIGAFLPLIVYLIQKRRNPTKYQWLTASFLLLMSAVASFPVTFGYIIQGVDTRPHLMRTDGVSMAFGEHRFPTLIYPNYSNDFGQLGCIYPDKFLYFPGLLRNRGVSWVASHNTMLFLINLTTVVIIYLCAKYLTKSMKASIIASVIMCYVPHRMYIMYVGGQALGMGLAMMFIPVVLTALYDVLLCEGKKWWLLSIGVCGVMFSHILTLVFTAIMCVVTFLFCQVLLYSRCKKDFIKKNINIAAILFKTFVVVLWIGLSTIVPWVFYYSQGLRTDKMSLDFMLSMTTTRDHYLSQNGLAHILILLLVIVAIIVYKRTETTFMTQKGHYAYYCIYLLIAGYGLFWMSTNLFPWRFFAQIPIISKGLNMFQFAERFMVIGIPSIALGFAMLIAPIIDDISVKNIGKTVVVACCAVLIVLGIDDVLQDLKICDICVWDQLTGEIYYLQHGYLPKGTEIDYYTSWAPICGDWDAVNNISYIRNGTSTHYEYTNTLDGNWMEFPTFYYKGYHAYDALGNELPIINSEHNRIKIQLICSDEPQVIDIRYEVYTVFKLCCLISVVGFIWLCWYIFVKERHPLSLLS